MAELLDSLNALGARIEHIWVVDTEFIVRGGSRQQPVCVVFHDLISDAVIRLFLPAQAPYPKCPVDCSKRSLFVAYASQAELLTFIELGWQMPCRILDLSIEWRAINNEETKLKTMKSEAARANREDTISPLSLLGVCAHYGIHSRTVEHKEAMRNLILRGFPYTPGEEAEILDYCNEDVDDTTALLEKMTPQLIACERGLQAAIFRGCSARGFAWGQHVGIPLDVDLLERLKRYWDEIFDALYADVKRAFPVFNEGSYDIAPKLWCQFLTDRGYISKWPLTVGGKAHKNRQPRRDKETLDAMSGILPAFKPLYEIINIRSNTKLGLRFPFGEDGRSRLNFFDFGTTTGRCSPSSSLFVLAGGSPAFRHLVKPLQDEAVIEADWSQQEMWIAAYLSGDRKMREMLNAGDAYIAFGVLANLLPPDASKDPAKSPYPQDTAALHAVLREQLKAVALGVLYGKSEFTIAKDCGMSVEEAKHLLRVHHRLFPTFWNWINAIVNEALAAKKISTKFGWVRFLAPKCKREPGDYGKAVKSIVNSLQNFPMQAHGAEMLRIAMTNMADQKIGVCAPLHDAVFISCRIEDIEPTKQAVRACMDAAAVAVIGVPVPIEMGITAYPDRFVPSKKPHAITTWARIIELLKHFESRDIQPGLVVQSDSPGQNGNIVNLRAGMGISAPEPLLH